MTDLASLIARLEAAERPLGSDSAYDMAEDIGDAVGLDTEARWRLRDALMGSLDSALSLAPEGCAVDFKRFQNTGDGWACVWTARGNRSGNGKTVAIALTAAALKAWAQG